MAYNIFERWPFTSFQNLNLDWLLKTVKTAAEQAAEAAQTVSSYAARLLDIEVINRQQNSRLDNLETTDETFTQDIRSLNGWNQEQDNNIQALSNYNDQQDARISALEAADNDNVKITVQELDGTEKTIARDNIGAGTSTVTYDDDISVLTIENVLTGDLETVPIGGGGGNPNAVLYVQQNLTNSQKVQARSNIGAGISTVSYDENTGVLTIINGITGATTAYRIPVDTVRYDVQTLTDSQKAQARENIGAIAEAVQYTVQTLTEAQKLQARRNIGADDPAIFPIVAVYANGEYTFDRNQADILAAIQRGQLPVVRYHTTAGQSDYDVYHEWVFSYYTYDGEDVYIYFSRVDQQGNVSQMRWFASTGKAVVVTTVTLPAATGADDGKIPMVNSFGNYQLVTIPAAENTSFGT